MGGFILIDRFTNTTVAAGLLHFALRRAENIHWQAVEVDKNARAGLKGQRPALVWFTGIDSPYEPPESPELHLDASGTVPAETSAELVIVHLRQAGILTAPSEG